MQTTEDVIKLDPGEGFDSAERSVWGKQVVKAAQMGFVQSQFWPRLERNIQRSYFGLIKIV